jgi:hypothetical protein
VLRQQEREHRPLLGSSEVDGGPVPQDLQWAEHAESQLVLSIRWLTGHSDTTFQRCVLESSRAAAVPMSINQPRGVALA